MTDLKPGILLWNQATSWPEQLEAAQPRRPARLRPPLGVGPPLRDLRRPVPADLRGLDVARGVGDGHEADAAGAAGRRQHVPQPGPRRQDRGDARPHQRRPRDPRASAAPGSSLEHTAHGIDFGTGFGQRLDWLDESVGAMRGVSRRRVRSPRAPGGHYAVRRPAPPAAARPEAPADHDRRLGREEDAAHGRQVRRHVERRWARSR